MKVYVNWSSGKDAALAFFEAQEAGHNIVGLMTTIGNDEAVPMHKIPCSLVAKQAEAIGAPLVTAVIPDPYSEEEFRRRITSAVDEARKLGAEGAVFGDVSLAGSRERRERALTGSGIEAVLPIWGQSSKETVERFISVGFKAIVVEVDGAMLDRSFAGREFDGAFLADLPQGVDPCGENGEFHTFVYDGPIFKRPVPFTIKGVEALRYPEVEHPYWRCIIE